MSSSIPKPDFPQPRQRRSSIGQAAALAATPTAAPADGDGDQTTAPAEDAQPDQMPAAPTKPSMKRAANATETRPRTRGAGTRSGGADTSASPAVEYKRLGGSRDILLSVPEDLKERMVNTITWTQPHTGIGQQQKFIRKAILDLCERLERDHNQGNPFPQRVVSE